MPRGNTVTSVTYADLLKILQRPAIKFKQRAITSTGLLFQHDNFRPILPVQLLQKSKICHSSVFHIRRTRENLSPLPFMYLDRSKWRWGQVYQV
jgi:hypothetical protein